MQPIVNITGYIVLLIQALLKKKKNFFLNYFKFIPFGYEHECPELGQNMSQAIKILKKLDMKSLNKPNQNFFNENDKETPMKSILEK